MASKENIYQSEKKGKIEGNLLSYDNRYYEIKTVNPTCVIVEIQSEKDTLFGRDGDEFPLDRLEF